MIDRSLVLLARMRFAAWVRRIRRGFSTRRGLAFFIVGCVMFALWLLPSMFASAMGTHRSNPETVRQAMPLILLGFTLLMALFSGGKIISFSAAEVSFLFPGPFSRHELVLYKIAITAFAALWVSLMLSVWQVRHSSMWIAAFAGIWLAWLFAQSLAMVVLLARQAITARQSSWPVRAAFLAMFALLAVALFDITQPLWRGEFDMPALLTHARQSRAVRIVLAPFDALTMAFTAERLWPDLVLWSAVSLGMIAGLIALILRLDHTFVETSLVASEHVQARVQRMKRGGNALSNVRPMQRLRIGMLPWLGGAGPVMWRQLMLAVRGAKGLLFVLILLAAGLGPMLWITTRKQEAAVPMLIVGGFWLVFLLPSIVRFDFRADLEHMDALKLLPIRPAMVALGQILSPVVVLTTVAWILALAAAVIVPQLALQTLAAAAFVPVLLLLIVGLENAVFLMFPTAQKMTTPGDMSMMGRAMVVFFVKALVMLAALGVVAGAGAIAFALSGSWTAALATAWAALAAAAVAMVPLVARLFVRFDPSMDRPAE